MPWSIAERDGKWCVIKDSDGSSAGCHDTRAQAIKQQRALYANEPGARTATIEPEIDLSHIFGNGQQNPVRVEIAPPSPEPMRVEIAAVHQELTEAVIASLAQVTERLVQTEETMAKVVEAVERMAGIQAQERESLTAAIGDMPAPIVNVTVPEPVVNITVPTPEVNVDVGAARKEVRFQRNLEGRIEGAVIEEDPNG